MKKNSLIISALAIIGIAACTSLKEESIGMEDFAGAIFYASIETPADSASTKVYADNTLHVLWNSDDRISIFNKYSVNQEYQFTGEDGDKSGSFKKVPNDDFVTGSELSYVYAVYPHAESSKISNDGVLTLTLPAEQAYKEASFGLGANTMVSVTANNNLQFKNAGGYISFKFYGDNVKVSSISLKGNNGEKLAGKATVAMASGGTPSVAMQGTATETVTLACANPVTLGTSQGTASEFWLVLPPSTFSKGFTVTITDPDGKTFTKSTSASLTIRRNGLTRMAALEVTIEPPVPSSENISFVDPVAKYACVEKFDTNGDGEVSYEEAAAVTSLSGLFKDWNTVTKFNEIKYFTAVTSTEGVFTGLPKLESITIPDNITTLGNFQNCTSLKTVVLPIALTSLPAYCFDACSSLTSIVLPSEITTIPDYCFRDCKKLTDIDLPSALKTIGKYAFQNCSCITSVNFPSTLTSIGSNAYYGSGLTSVIVPSATLGEYAFMKCKSLETVVFPSEMTSIPMGLFRECTALRAITWPEALESIGLQAFGDCSFKDANYTLELPSTVKTIGSSAIGPVRHLIVPSTSAVSIASNSFDKDYTIIYVPSSMVEMYKMRTNWSRYDSFIKQISDYPVKEPFAVDLGLSVKWASCNVGAFFPEEYGKYYAWGETEDKEYYEWSTYKYCNGTEYSITKYNTSSFYGAVDNLTTLEPDDDTAHIIWGETWRMPTREEWIELLNNCSWGWTSNYKSTGVAGLTLTSKMTGYTDRRLFLPAAGCIVDYDLNNFGAQGLYWSSSNPSSGNLAYCMAFTNSSMHNPGYASRCHGSSVRPVTE